MSLWMRHTASDDARTRELTRQPRQLFSCWLLCSSCLSSWAINSTRCKWQIAKLRPKSKKSESRSPPCVWVYMCGCMCLSVRAQARVRVPSGAAHQVLAMTSVATVAAEKGGWQRQVFSQRQVDAAAGRGCGGRRAGLEGDHVWRLRDIGAEARER